jgi:Ca2+-binding EF-hand superfamily protein
MKLNKQCIRLLTIIYLSSVMNTLRKESETSFLEAKESQDPTMADVPLPAPVVPADPNITPVPTTTLPTDPNVVPTIPVATSTPGVTPVIPVVVPTNSTAPIPMSKSLYAALNNTIVRQDLPTFKTMTKGYNNNKLLSHQLDELYMDLLRFDHTELTEGDIRSGIKVFIDNFEACDKNNNTYLNLAEFTACMTTDPFLNKVTPPPPQFASYANYTIPSEFYEELFNRLDTFHMGFINLHDYMMLRLFVFSLKKCSVISPFIEEIAFECAIDIVSGTRTLPRTTARHVYNLGVELSNSFGSRNMDFITFTTVAESARLFSKINKKQDLDATKSEFMLALDKNILPMRYNEAIVQQMFRLVDDDSMDIVTFIFYDNMLKLFDIPNPERKYHLNITEFTNLMSDHLFPRRVLQEIKNIPQNNITAESYQMRQYQNLPKYYDEDMHLMKFLQKNYKVMSQEKVQVANITLNLPYTAYRLFKVLDNENDGFINFYDFSKFLQIAYIFGQGDTNNQYRIIGSNLYDIFNLHSGYPVINLDSKNKARRFRLISDTYIDLLDALLIERIEDIVQKFARRNDPSTLYEVELKTIFNNVGLQFVPDAVFNKCLRGMDDKNIPLYDWECAFLEAEKATLNYYENSRAYLLAGSNNITLTNTAFINTDKALG